MKSAIINFIVQSQNTDGGWGYFPGKESTPEPTAYALLALASFEEYSQIRQRALHFLLQNQHSSGGWAVSERDPEAAAWVSAIAAFSIFKIEGTTPPTRSATTFVLNSFSRMPIGNLNRLVNFLTGSKGSLFDVKLGGWCWTPSTAPWVEPTCHALIFLNAIRPHLSGYPKMAGIISEAELMLYDRICRQGGWNYGNSHVLGEDLQPYPLTTAWALIALQDFKTKPENQRSVDYLKESIKTEKSMATLALENIVLELYNQRAEVQIRRLTSAPPQDFLKNIKTAALILIVAQTVEGKNPFRY